MNTNEMERVETVTRDGQMVTIATTEGRVLSVNSRAWKSTFNMEANEVRMWVLDKITKAVGR